MSRIAAVAGMLLGLCLAADRSHAQGNPLPPGNVTLVVPFAPGGPIDVVARLLADKIGTKHGRVVVVENRTGAAGNVGAAAVARAEPNGLTWLLAVDSLWTVNPYLGGAATFDLDKSLVPVGQLGQVVLMLAIHPKVPAKTWPELVAYSKTKSLNFGSAGLGAPGHLAFEYLKMSAPLDAVHVPFRGASQAMTELLAGNVDGAFIAAGVMLDYVNTGKIRALAVSDSKRMALFPNLPTADEIGIKGFEARFTNIMAVPAGVSEPVRAFLQAEMKAFIGLDDVKVRLAAIGTEPLQTGEAATRAWIAQERARWSKVVQARGLKATPPPAAPATQSK